jgi:hypothetical protein
MTRRAEANLRNRLNPPEARIDPAVKVMGQPYQVPQVAGPQMRPLQRLSKAGLRVLIISSAVKLRKVASTILLFIKDCTVLPGTTAQRVAMGDIKVLGTI